MPQTNIGKTQFRRFLTKWFTLEKILYLFWFFFWFLNGLDKFFNGKNKDYGEPWGVQPYGWFGVNRDDKFIHYFDRLDLPAWMALSSLYFFAVVELIVGALFLIIFFQATPKSDLVRVAFKTGILLFLMFMVGDVFFGDRMELWEHGTFLIITLMTYRLYLMRFDEYAEMIGAEHLDSADLDRDGRISTAEFGAFMRRLQAYGMKGDPEKKEGVSDPPGPERESGSGPARPD